MLAEKALRIIRSCRTLEQLMVAERYALLARKRVPDRKLWAIAETALWSRFHGIKQEIRRTS
jgi:hypothetical protein